MFSEYLDHICILLIFFLCPNEGTCLPKLYISCLVGSYSALYIHIYLYTYISYLHNKKLLLFSKLLALLTEEKSPKPCSKFDHEIKLGYNSTLRPPNLPNNLCQHTSSTSPNE